MRFGRLGKAVEETEPARRPPAPPIPDKGPFSRDFWRSPLRGEWLTSFLGSAMLPLLFIAALTGYLSHAAYDPSLGTNDVSGGFEKNLYFFDWPTSPAWLYSITQGSHILAGIAVVPILLAKLWSVIPKLFTRPAVRSVAHSLERVSVALLVGSSLFLLATGIINIQYWLPFGFSFVPAHYYAAVIFGGALGLHLALKLPIVGRAFARDGAFRPLGDGIEKMRAADPALDDLAPTNPGPTTITRRGMLAGVGLGSLTLVAMTAGQSLFSGLRETALLGPRGRSYGDGPNDFQVNKTASTAGIEPSQVGDDWRLQLVNGDAEPIRLTRTDLLGMEQRTERLPIACVEGWTTYQTWTGIPLARLAEMAGVEGDATVLVESVQEGGAFRQATLNPGQINDTRSLLALKVNDTTLSMDHGYPARVIVPALPGVHNTKWVGKMTFMAA